MSARDEIEAVLTEFEFYVGPVGIVRRAVDHSHDVLARHPSVMAPWGKPHCRGDHLPDCEGGVVMVNDCAEIMSLLAFWVAR